MKQKKRSSIIEQVKSARKQSRDEEIQKHGKSINYRKVMASKKQYNRKKNKADDEVLPYFFGYGWNYIVIMKTKYLSKIRQKNFSTDSYHLQKSNEHIVVDKPAKRK